MNKTEVLEIISVKTQMVCNGYYLDSVPKNSFLYIRPITARLFKPISKKQSKYIFKAAHAMLIQKLEQREAEQGPDRTTHPNGLLSSGDIWGITNYVRKLGRERLSESDRLILDERIMWLQKQLTIKVEGSDIIPDMQTFLHMALNREPHDDMIMSELLFEGNFGNTDVVKATGDLIEIGRKLKRYSYDKIVDIDFKDGDLEAITEMVMAFACKHGLLGLLNRVFIISDDLHLGKLDMREANVSTFMGEAYIALWKSSKDARSLPPDMMMRLSDYIKLFFPERSYMTDYEQYKNMDESYWVRYSEPLHLFLLAAKVLFEELEVLRKSDNPYMTYAKFKGISMNLEYSEEYQAHVYRYQFVSLFDAIRYYALYGVNRTNNTFRCVHCHKIVIKYNKHRRNYCSSACSNRYNSAKSKRRAKEALSVPTSEPYVVGTDH